MKTALIALSMLQLCAAKHSMYVDEPKLCCGWRKSQDLTAVEGTTVDLSFHIRESNMEKVRDIVEKVTDPKSESYGKFLTAQEISDLTKPAHADVHVVTRFLKKHNIHHTVSNHRIVKASVPVAIAEEAFSTKFQYLHNKQTGQKVLRASSYVLPAEFEGAVAATFGFHGLPLPKQKPLIAPGNPADVTPAVIYSTYSIPDRIHIQGDDKVRQAVAEFQGQFEKDSDLASFFKQYVPNAAPGDEKVAKFVGNKDQQSAGIEASLDIQYIMGVAPHVKTEFWLFTPMDFCADLVNWTNTILADDAAPLVHSVSYGWQGDLSQVQCTNDKVSAVDGNFAKLAARGITIIFASGDSGSGYSPHSTCSPSSGTKGEELEGDVKSTVKAQEVFQCCDSADFEGAAGWTYALPKNHTPTPGATCQGTDIGTKDEAYTGTPVHTFKVPEPQFCCEITRNLGKYFSFTPQKGSSQQGNCSIFNEVSGKKHVKGAYSGTPSTPVEGTCTLYSKVTGKKSNPKATSGSKATPQKVQLYPSWPASSPYVTAVGATRFVGQKVGNAEMATDQFGSGGGFSDMFKQTPNAKWQVEAVAHYVNNPPNDPHYPPKGSFDPNGRATPDVSALGEGYQVVANGAVQPVGGTSASAPAFAGIIALINDARAQKGKKGLGFLNPFLYQNADCFTDVTLGTNAIGRGTGPIAYGFNATKGWDPATGLGTPIFNKLLEAALKI